MKTFFSFGVHTSPEEMLISPKQFPHESIDLQVYVTLSNTHPP